MVATDGMMQLCARPRAARAAASAGKGAALLAAGLQFQAGSRSTPGHVQGQIGMTTDRAGLTQPAC